MSTMNSRDFSDLQDLMCLYGLVTLVETLGELAGPQWTDIFTDAVDKLRERAKQVEPRGVLPTHS